MARVGESKAAIADHVTRYYPLDFTLDEIREDVYKRQGPQQTTRY